MKNITKVQLGKNGPFVSRLGLGCMRMSSIWGGSVPDETESIATIHEALDNGINFLNTGNFYGAGHNEMLIGKAIKRRRNDVFISVKFGAIFHNGQPLGMDLRPPSIKNYVNYSLTRLGIETIDLLVAFGNTAEGLLTGEIKAPLAADDYRNHFTRFQKENLIHNFFKSGLIL